MYSRCTYIMFFSVCDCWWKFPDLLVPLTCNFAFIFTCEPIINNDLLASDALVNKHLKVCALFCSCLINMRWLMRAHELSVHWAWVSVTSTWTDRDTLSSAYRLVPVQIQTQSHSCFHSQAGACADTNTVTFLSPTHRLVPVQIQTQSHSCFHSQAGACTDTDTVSFLFPLTGWCLYRYRHSHDLVSYSQAGADVFNALDIMDNKQVLEELKFGVGDGNLHYYLYNWKCPSMPPNEVRIHNFR